MTVPSNREAHDLCKVGQGAACCRYLAMSVRGWSCEKLTPLGRLLDARVERGEMNARGDNCPGKDTLTNPNAPPPPLDDERS